MTCHLLRRSAAGLILAALASCASNSPLSTQPVGTAVVDGTRSTPSLDATVRPTTWNTHVPESFAPRVAPEPTTTASTATAQRPPGVDKSDWAPLTVSLSATCLERGDELTVTATSTPNAGLGFAVGYSKPPKGEPKVVPDFAYFDHESNPTGTISWAFVIRPTVPYGDGVVKVIANGADGRGAFQSLDIEIAASCA